ncbi:MAG: TIR domain-containing protein [Promethearchaeota archaeon]
MDDWIEADRLFKNNEFEKAKKIYKKILKNSKKRNNLILTLDSLRSISDCDLNLKDYKKAKDGYSKLLNQAKQTNTEFFEGFAYWGLGIIELNTDWNLDKALEYFKKGEKKGRKISDNYLLGWILRQMASLNKQKGDKMTALIQYKEARNCLKKVNDERYADFDYIIDQLKSELESEDVQQLKEQERVIEKELKKDMLIFISYATEDAELYKILELAKKLETYNKIGKVFCWQEDVYDDIIKYMNENIGKCDVMILFCSPNALVSESVYDEWRAAYKLKKPIIPVFIKLEDIPPLLSPRLAIEFDITDFQKNVQKIYELILKKIQNYTY